MTVANAGAHQVRTLVPTWCVGLHMRSTGHNLWWQRRWTPLESCPCFWHLAEGCPALRCLPWGRCACVRVLRRANLADLQGISERAGCAPRPASWADQPARQVVRLTALSVPDSTFAGSHRRTVLGSPTGVQPRRNPKPSRGAHACAQKKTSNELTRSHQRGACAMHLLDRAAAMAAAARCGGRHAAGV